MIFTSGLFFVLALASTLAADQAKVDKIMNQITTSVVNDLIKVAKESKGAKDLDAKLLSETKVAMKREESHIKEVAKLSGMTAAQVAKKLSENINKNKALSAAVGAGDKQHAPRFIGALVLGITQIVTDTVKMALTRY